MNRAALTALLAATALAACSSSTSEAPAIPATPVPGTTAVTFEIVVPAPKRKAHYIPASTQSVVIVLSGKTLTVADVSASSSACTSGVRSRICEAKVLAAGGEQTFDLTAYDGANGRGNVLASGSVSATLAANTPQRIHVSLTGMPASVTLALQPASQPAGSASTTKIVVRALDADGNTILGAYSASIALTNGDKSGASKLSVTRVQNSSTQVELAYDGSSLSVARLTAHTPGLPAAAASFVPVPTTIAQYIPPTVAGSDPGLSDICYGPDGNMWATGAGMGSIEKIAPDGTFTAYPILATEPVGISVGSDHDLWFAEQQTGEIGKITTAGKITTYRIPAKGAQPVWTALGPDGRTWFVNLSDGSPGLGAVDSSGRIDTYALPRQSSPVEIVTGPDGNLWITDEGLNAILVASPSGHVIAKHRLRTAPWGIAVGPDKNIWFTEFEAGRIARMTTSGTLREFPLPSPSSGPLNVAAGPDGNVWFTESGGGAWNVVGKIGYMTTDGSVILDFPTPPGANSPLSHVHNLAFDAKGVLWYTKFNIGSSSVAKLIY
jgi:streptogramin lyase